ncbi:fluoride efflux transporter CrcB [Cruoricaptor ignavus]|uniref:Fluoride-specific ion channel FluC n=1 Tax=Cruoricaptor ignavus TaxID=1118202 RepID=A0A7M1T3H2_9FLAO|nr:fluoride efflux transporter CrcB [Cruoricaptor ignavus]QOR74359.1 fluoride efflux transporter CrcB [Cruoricaptor ignavus]
MKQILYIFLGGGLGSVLRFLISKHTQKLWNISSFPVGTFVVNIIGCFLIGLFSAYFFKTDSQLKFFMIAGFCGGFTTFSTFSAENYSLWQSGNSFVLVAYVLLSVFVGLAAVFVGSHLMKS